MKSITFVCGAMVAMMLVMAYRTPTPDEKGLFLLIALLFLISGVLAFIMQEK